MLYNEADYSSRPMFVNKNVNKIVNIQSFPLIVFFAVSGFLLFYKLNELMPFIGDQAWFYLSARDIWLKGEIPLVGITSSHTWLHQGPLWTYVLAVLLPLGKYNPLLPAYFTAAMTLVTAGFLYYTGKKFFTARVALIATALFATSPLVIMYGRMPYHTTLIPLFCLLLYYSLCRVTQGKKEFFPFIFFSLSILYNLELATVLLWLVPVAVVIYGWYRKEKWYKGLLTKKTVGLSIFLSLLPLIPILIYDVTHGFPQTVVFMGWIMYRFAHIFVPSLTTKEAPHTMLETIQFLYRNNGLFFSGVLFPVVAILSVLSVCAGLLQLRKTFSMPLFILLFFTVIITFGFIVNKTPSEAYLPLFFVFIPLIVSHFLTTRIPKIIVFLLVAGILLSNIWYIFHSQYRVDIPFSRRVEVAEKIVRDAQGKPFSLLARGTGSQFESTTMNTEYLTWWKGGHPQKKMQRLEFLLYETPGKLEVRPNFY